MRSTAALSRRRRCEEVQVGLVLLDQAFGQAFAFGLPRCSRWIEPRRVPLIEELVVTGAWWDYVDAIAGRAMGTMLAGHPQPTKTLLRGWARSDNVWSAPPRSSRNCTGSRRRTGSCWADVIHRRAGVLPAQGHRVGAASVLEDRPRLGDGVHRHARRPSGLSRGEALKHAARAALMLDPSRRRPHGPAGSRQGPAVDRPAWDCKVSSSPTTTPVGGAQAGRRHVAGLPWRGFC